MKLRQSSLAKEGDLGISSSSFTIKSDADNALLKVGYRGSPFVSSDDTDRRIASLFNISELMLDSGAFADAIDALKTGPDLLLPAFVKSPWLHEA